MNAAGTRKFTVWLGVRPQRLLGIKRMKAVLLAGGLGTRIIEESVLRPKPMIEIGGRPILWHIMKIYSQAGISEFVVCCGYKAYMIKEYFANYPLHRSDITIDIQKNKIDFHKKNAEPWRITLVDTGENTMTGGRLKRVAEYLEDEEAFCFTYGDGVADIDVKALCDFHLSHSKPATITAVQPQGRYGALELSGSSVSGFTEKPKGDGGWINGGFFVLSPDVISTIDGDDTPWEAFPLETLAATDQLEAYFHHGFWQPMDTLRDRNHLEALWVSGKAPWKLWA